jgi:peroxiredoxin
MTPLALQENAADFRLPGTDGKDHALADYAEAPVLVVAWWCNHCPYVQAYEERVIALQREFAGQGVRVVAINSNSAQSHPQDGFEAMIERAKAKGYNFDYLRDESQDVARAYGAQRTPEAFVFDAERRLRYHGGIDDSWDKPGGVTKRPLHDAIVTLLGGGEPNPPTSSVVGCTVKWNSQD